MRAKWHTMHAGQRRSQSPRLPLAALGLAFLLGGCFFAKSHTRLVKELAISPSEVVLAQVENTTGERLEVKSGLLSRFLSTISSTPSTVPRLMEEALRQELEAEGVKVIDPDSPAAGANALRIAVTIQEWEEATGPAYGQVLFLTATYRLIEDASGATVWEVQQQSFPLRVERIGLGKLQTERALVTAVRDALRHWPQR